MSIITFSGLASGIDSASLIDALIQQKRSTRIRPIEQRIGRYEEQNSALKELRSRLEALKSHANNFRVLNGGGIKKLASSGDESVLGATASSQATSGSYAVTVDQLAKNGTYTFKSSGHTYDSSSDAIASGMGIGTDQVTITVGDKAQENISINIDSSTTLAQFVESFNSQSSLANASLVNLGTGGTNNYVIMINSSQTGLPEGSLSVDLSGATNVLADGAFDDNQNSAATDAVLTVDGLGTSITRSSNTISDLISGLTISLQGVGSSVVTISNDPLSTSNALRDFVDAYNDIVDYITQNDLVRQEKSGGETINVFGPLAETSLDNNILSSLRSVLASTSAGGGSVNILADLGVTTERDGTLKYDSETLEGALASSPQGVQSILENLGEKLAAVDGTINQFTRFNGLIDVSIKGTTRQMATLTERISVLEGQLAEERERLTNRFARLEAAMGSMQQQQTSLAFLFPPSN